MPSLACSEKLLSEPLGSTSNSSHDLNRRHLGRQDRRAMTTLAHSIEYLTGESRQEALSNGERQNLIQAVQLLMTLNGRIYFESPQVPRLADRLRVLLHLRRAW